MAVSSITIISGGTTYHLTNGGTAQSHYSGSGTPWTTQSTTPYQIAMNSAAGQAWTPLAAKRMETYSGGPVFRNGRTLEGAAYDNVPEQLTIQCYATSHDNAVKLKQQLDQILNTALYSLPAVLAVKPEGATNTVYYEILGADVQEDARFINEESGLFISNAKGVLRAVVTWRRSYVGGASSLATLVNGATMTNRGTSTNPNIQALGTLTGDLINEGQPLNIKMVKPSGTSAPSRFYLATVASRVYTAIATGPFTTTSGTTIGSITPDITAALTNDNLIARFVGRVKTLTNPTKADVSVRVYTSGAAFIWQSNWVTLLGNTTGQYVDFGAMDLSFFHVPIATSATLSADILVRSNDGTSITLTLDYMEFLLYYDFCYIDFPTSIGTGEAVFLTQAQNRSGGGWLPLSPARGYYGTSASVFDPTIAGTIVGDPPLARPSTSLYVAWRSSQLDGGHVTTETSTVTVTHAPLYRTLRGGG